MIVFFGPVFCCRMPPAMAANGAAILSKLTINDFSYVMMLNSEHGSESWTMRIAGKLLLMPKHKSSAKSGRRANTCSNKELHLSSFYYILEHTWFCLFDRPLSVRSMSSIILWFSMRRSCKKNYSSVQRLQNLFFYTYSFFSFCSIWKYSLAKSSRILEPSLQLLYWE